MVMVNYWARECTASITVWVRIFVVLNFRVLGKRIQCLIFAGINFRRYVKRMPVFFTFLAMQECGKEIDKAPGKGLLLEVPLSCLCRVAAPPCYQHRSWEPVRCPAGSASSRLAGVTPSSLLLIIHRTLVS